MIGAVMWSGRAGRGYALRLAGVPVWCEPVAEGRPPRRWETARRLRRMARQGVGEVAAPPTWRAGLERAALRPADAGAFFHRFAGEIVQAAWPHARRPLPVLIARGADADVLRCALALVRTGRELAIDAGADTERLRQTIWQESGAAVLTGAWHSQSTLPIVWDETGRGHPALARAELLINFSGEPLPFAGPQAMGAEARGEALGPGRCADSAALAAALLRAGADLRGRVAAGPVRWHKTP